MSLMDFYSILNIFRLFGIQIILVVVGYLLWKRKQDVWTRGALLGFLAQLLFSALIFGYLFIPGVDGIDDYSNNQRVVDYFSTLSSLGDYIGALCLAVFSYRLYKYDSPNT